MKRLLRKIIILFFATIFSTQLFAEELKIEDIVKKEFLEELKTKGFIVSVQNEGTDEFRLLPETPYKEEFIKNKVEKGKKNFSYIYESLYYMPKQEILELSKSEKDTITIRDVSKIFRSISKMEGMKYYSTTKKKERILYKKAYTIENATSFEPVPDKTEGSADGLQLFCLQDDSSFGECRYQLDYKETEQFLYTVFTNLDDLGLGPFKAIYPENLKLSVLAADLGDYLFVYLISDINSVNLPGVKGQITNSISSRMDAIIDWFLVQF